MSTYLAAPDWVTPLRSRVSRPGEETVWFQAVFESYRYWEIRWDIPSEVGLAESKRNTVSWATRSTM